MTYDMFAKVGATMLLLIGVLCFLSLGIDDDRWLNRIKLAVIVLAICSAAWLIIEIWLL